MKLSAMLIDVLRKLPYEDNVRWLKDAGYQAVDPPLHEPNAGDIARKHGLEPGCANAGGASWAPTTHPAGQDPRRGAQGDPVGGRRRRRAA